MLQFSEENQLPSVTVSFILIAVFAGVQHGIAFDLFPLNNEIIYRLVADVTLVPDFQAQPNYVWTLAGQLRVQRYDPNNLAVKVGNEN